MKKEQRRQIPLPQLCGHKEVVRFSETSNGKVPNPSERALSPQKKPYFMRLSGLQKVVNRNASRHPLPHFRILRSELTSKPTTVLHPDR
jgi:hypothetical protein